MASNRPRQDDSPMAAAPLASSAEPRITFGSGAVGVTEAWCSRALALLLETGVSLAEAVKILHVRTGPRLAHSSGRRRRVSEGNPLRGAREPQRMCADLCQPGRGRRRGPASCRGLEQLRAMDEKNSGFGGNITRRFLPGFLIFLSEAVGFRLGSSSRNSRPLRTIRDTLPMPTIVMLFGPR